MLYCPICNSTDVYLIVGGYTGTIYRCKRCGYEGPLIVERDDQNIEPDSQ